MRLTHGQFSYRGRDTSQAAAVARETAADSRDRYEAFARSLRDVLSQRWLLTDATYERITDGCPAVYTCYTITTPKPFTLLFNQLYFPGWWVFPLLGAALLVLLTTLAHRHYAAAWRHP